MESSNERARKVALTLVLEGIEAADPLVAIKRFFEKEGNELVIKKVKGDVYVVGAGKATGGMAKAVEEVLGDRIKAGIIAVPEELVNDVKLSKIKVLGSTHPKASEKSVRAGKEIVNLVKNASEEDLVIALFSGGGSALVEYPV
ncbi:MAG: glycerate kinase, partial [Thermoprotei archaeon]